MTGSRWSAGLTLVLIAAAPAAGQERDMERDTDAGIERIVDFGSEEVGAWIVVNDGVMGGRSASDLFLDDEGVAVFRGTLSLENNGGFASVRGPVPPGSLAGASHMAMRVRGDGNRYQLRLRPGRRSDGIAFAARFETTPDWVTVEIPISAFEPTFRGRRPRGAGPLDPATVGQVGLMLTDGQAGPFRVEVAWIGVRRGG